MIWKRVQTRRNSHSRYREWHQSETRAHSRVRTQVHPRVDRTCSADRRRTECQYLMSRVESRATAAAASDARRKHVGTSGSLAGSFTAAAAAAGATAVIGCRRVRDAGPTVLLAPVTRARPPAGRTHHRRRRRRRSLHAPRAEAHST